MFMFMVKKLLDDLDHQHEVPVKVIIPYLDERTLFYSIRDNFRYSRGDIPSCLRKVRLK